MHNYTNNASEQQNNQDQPLINSADHLVQEENKVEIHEDFQVH